MAIKTDRKGERLSLSGPYEGRNYWGGAEMVMCIIMVTIQNI